MKSPSKDTANSSNDPSGNAPPIELSHVDAAGNAKMVEVGSKPVTRREATAEAFCLMNDKTATAIRENQHKKGDVLAVARIAGIQAAKKTAELIPLCHTIPLSSVSVDFEWDQQTRVRIASKAICVGQTGVEMEALCAASVAALTIYDMCKAMDPSIEIQAVRLVAKSGGKSDFRRLKSE